MQTLRIYRIEEKYVRYLHSRDAKVQYNKDAKRPYVGVVFDFAGFQYFVPMESPKPNHDNIKSGKHIMRLAGGEYGLLGFNNMIPVPRIALIEYDIRTEMDVQYRALMMRQAAIINRKKADILDHAQRTYFDVVSGKNKFLIANSCDFKALERACRTYNPNYTPKAKNKRPKQTR